MSYMNQAAFVPVGGIQELSFDEVDLVAAAYTAAEIAGAALAGAAATRTVAAIAGVTLGPEATAVVVLAGAVGGVVTLFATK